LSIGHAAASIVSVGTEEEDEDEEEDEELDVVELLERVE
jgi:hypothetical protein